MKYRSRFVFSAAIAALFISSPSFAHPPIPVPRSAAGHPFVFDTHKFMRVSEVRPGMRGYALTVFKGTKIEKFHIEVLGVVSKFNNGKDYILFRALDGPSVTEKLNIAHGMSGSPIYINGRLVGAISMGIPGTQFPKEPIALATPIEEMFDAWSPDLPSKATPISAMSETNAGSANALLAGQMPQQIDLPLTVSGMTSQGIARLSTALAPYHFTVLAGGGAGADVATNPLARNATLQPGSAVGVSLVQGDVDVTATGTVTYRDGNRLLLFGHPLADLGPLDAALTTAYVVNIFPSYQDSIKLGSPIKTVGRIFQDRPFSVGGVIGPMPNMVPMTVHVDDQSIKRRKDFHVRIINHPLLTGQFITQVADQLIAQVHGMPGDSMATVDLDVDAEEVGHVRRTNRFYDAQSIDQSAIGDLDSLMHLLSSNPFYPLAVKSVKMSVTIQNRHDTAEIDRIYIKQSNFAPGDTVDVGVVLKPFKHAKITRILQVKIPANTPNGALTLSLKGGGTDSGGISLGGLILIRPSSDSSEPAGNVSQLVKQFVEKPRNNELVARLILPTNAINIDGEKLTTLPPTIASVMQSAHSTGLRLERDEVKVVQQTPYIVSGSESLIINVQKKGVPETGASSGAAASPAEGASGPAAVASSGESSEESAETSSRRMTLTSLTQADPAANDLVSYADPLPETKKPAQSAAATSPRPVATAPGSATPTAAGQTAPAATPPAATPKIVTRTAQIWRQGSGSDFTSGTLKNMTVTSAGDIRLSPPLEKVAETNETYLWSLQPAANGDLYAGTGDHGIIYKINAAGKPAPFFRTSELEVNALAMDPQGNLYAGTSPHGVIFKISPDGRGSKFFTTEEKYVTALLYDAVHARLYAATGGGTGRIYALGANPAQKTSAWFTSPETHILSLAQDQAGNVYAGTAGEGIIYKISPDGAAKVLYNAAEPDITGLAADSSGNLYASTFPKGVIYKINADGTARALYDRASSGFLGLQMGAAGDLYACAGGTVYRIAPDETVQSFTTSNDAQFVTIATDPAHNEVYAGTSTVGAVYKIGEATTKGLSGTYQSVVHDAGNTSRWGTISWQAITPAGSHVTLQTRSGDVAQPDGSWSPWSRAYTNPAGENIQSPPARYLQYQATIAGDKPAAQQADTPLLQNVTVYYLPRNQAPSVKVTSPHDGDILSKAALIQWSASDPDKDTLTYDLAYSADNGKSWTPIKKKAVPQPNKPSSASAAATPAASAAPNTAAPATGPVTDQEVAQKVEQFRQNLDKHPEVPEKIKQQMLAQAPDIFRRALEQQRAQAAHNATTTNSSAVKETSYSWDTTEVPDGYYQVRVAASDKTSNPTDAMTAQSISPLFLIANKQPTVQAGDPAVAADKTVTLHGHAGSGLAFIKAVQYTVDDGDPLSAIADDGLFDSSSEAFTIITAPLTSGPHTLQVQVIDRAGNTTTTKVTVKVP